MCSDCGNEYSKWIGQCPACHAWNTISEVKLSGLSPKSKASTKDLKSISPQEAITSAQKTSFQSHISELDRVLGPGLTAGGVYLLAGEPGIGKSTLLTQLAISVVGAHHDAPANNHSILYICSEENTSQVGSRITRLSSKKDNIEHIKLLAADSAEDIITYVSKNPKTPDVIIVDSIQSIESSQVSSPAGTISQIRSCTNLLIHLAKTMSISIILVGHVTKSGNIAGPKLLEHMVDAVLQLEGDRHYDLRLLRGVKNRFGPTDETGIFQMTGTGLIPVTDPGQFFMSNRPSNTPGSALTMIMEGTRPLIVEIQALTTHSELAIPRRVAQGIPVTKLQLICAILTKHLHLNLSDQDVFLNVTGGLNLREPAADLAIALSIISSFKNLPLPDKSISLGELGLLGEIRPISNLKKRLKEAQSLGYTTPFTPEKYTLLNKIKI